MLRVIQSNRLEELAGALAEALPAGDPFARPTIVVSHPLVARWLQYELARRRTVIGNLDLPFLEPFLARTWEADELGGLDRRQLAVLIASALADREALAAPALAPVRAYLDTDGAEAVPVRRVQLAERVAGHLWDYALTRPDWLDAWDDGRDADLVRGADVDAATLAWQRHLYGVVLPQGLAARGDRRWAIIPRLPQARRRLGLGAPALAGPVHLFGFSYIPRAHVEALAAIDGAVHVAMLTPCTEYWEDVPGRSKRAAGGVEPLALVYWGGPGRDTAGMLVSASDGDVVERPADPRLGPAGDGPLAAWARDLLHRAAPAGPAPGDAEIAVLACPSISRELEIVGSEIWRALREDPTLRATDVAVLVAGDPATQERYLAQVGPAFGSLHRLPFHLIDAPAAQSGRVADAALELLELPLGRFTRREMLSLMTHPAVLARHPHVDPADWVRWCDRLGIAHGADAGDHAGTYLERAGDAFHWTQGIRRLAVGAFVAGARAGIDDPVELGGRELLPEELTPDLEASAATFALLARSLIADARWLAAREEPLARWATILAALVEAYLGDPPDAEGARARVLDSLRELGDLDLDGRAVPYREVVELARSRLGAMREGRGAPLAHGVRVAPLSPNRAIPAELVFVVGLGEGLYPAGDQPPPLDLRTQRRRGDLSPRDRDRYAFLEALLAARRRVVLSYVARDEQSGDPRAPSSLIHELAEMLAPYLGAPAPADALALLTVTHPLRRWDAAYAAPDRDPRLVPSASPAAARERHALDVRRSLDDHLTAQRRAAPDAGRLRELLAAPGVVELRRRLRLDLADGVPPPEVDADAPVVLSLSTLRKFLEMPVQAWAQVVLHLEELDLDDDGADREDEPFDVSALERATALRESFAAHLATGVTVDDAYARVRRRRELAGQTPLGPFGEVVRRRDLELLREWSEELSTRGAIAGPWVRFAFGRAGVRDARLEPAIALDVDVRGRRRRIEIVGTTELVGGERRDRSIVLVPGDPGEHHHLRHALDHLALAAAGVAGGARDGLVLGKKPEARRLLPWTRDEACAHLARLAGELLGMPHAYYLPLVTARTALEGAPKRMKNNDKAPPLGYGPIDRDPGLAIPADAAAIARRRLGPLLAHMEEP